MPDSLEKYYRELDQSLILYEKEAKYMADATSTSTRPGKGWWTIAINSAVAVAGVLTAANWADLVPAQYAGAIVAVLGFVNVWLRSITTTSVGTK